MWITSKARLEQLAAKDRLRKLLIRRGVDAQDVENLIEILTQSDCYVRDIEVPK